MRNKIYRVIAIFAICFGFALVNAQAQAPSKVKADIPFEFSAGRTTLPAGVYTVKRISANVLTLRGEDGKSKVILNAPVTNTSTDPNAVERLVFSKQGEKFFLSQVWLTADSGRQVWTGRSVERIEIALKR
ncbi:MAG TPA: hypothetical protein VFI24_06290 [Pyrinomonadaceae bacterium]|nr:hypothetical protein [Pyrinomonadaceae bacterium]